ncbi:hypothetical protein EJ06DRAFT_557249 [Trichodelitschia bisporula]|uniref:Uncharacterized protein n=1 Tax=Trichodelitschia bisporula TaxID=703511 RepID=A0A6G1HUJ0_9PEZI|nr:hypothetical protein EJ06DRAFT_557249 [Trichodelitschia bisporula]
MTAILVTFDLDALAFDAINAFANSDLDDSVAIFTYPPQGFPTPGHVYRLDKLSMDSAGYDSGSNIHICNDRWAYIEDAFAGSDGSNVVHHDASKTKIPAIGSVAITVETPNDEKT